MTIDYFILWFYIQYLLPIMGNELCNPSPSTKIYNQNYLSNIEDIHIASRKGPSLQNEAEENNLNKQIPNQQKEEVNELIEESSFPLVNKHAEQKIKALTKIQSKPIKVWKVKQYNIVYANIDQQSTNALPKGYIQLYKLKENGDFQGYFEGHIDENYQPIIDSQAIFVFSNASYFTGTGPNEGNYINQVTGLNFSGGWKDEQPQGYGKEKNNKGTYKGQYNLGQKQGKGIFEWIGQQKLTYEGYFVKGLFSGKGTIIDEKSQFKNGQKHGYGIQNEQLQIYEGYFHKGQRCGKGRLNILDPFDKSVLTVFQGNFYQGIPNGRGKVSKRNQKEVQGIWEDGHLIAMQ